MILDEITYLVHVGVGRHRRSRRCPPRSSRDVNVVVTGRDAPQRSIEIADTVTEMRKVKHAYDRGIAASKASSTELVVYGVLQALTHSWMRRMPSSMSSSASAKLKRP